MSKTGNAMPTGLNFGGKAATRIAGLIAVNERENRRRVKCDHCDLMILPETMARHVELCHED